MKWGKGKKFASALDKSGVGLRGGESCCMECVYLARRWTCTRRTWQRKGEKSKIGSKDWDIESSFLWDKKERVWRWRGGRGRKYKIIIERENGQEWVWSVAVKIGHEGGRMLPTDSLRIMRVWAIVSGRHPKRPRNAHWGKPQLLLRILYVFRLSRIYLRSGALKRNVLSSGYVSFSFFLSVLLSFPSRKPATTAGHSTSTSPTTYSYDNAWGSPPPPPHEAKARYITPHAWWS